jgi:hypothetical protein
MRYTGFWLPDNRPMAGLGWISLCQRRSFYLMLIQNLADSVKCLVHRNNIIFEQNFTLHKQKILQYNQLFPASNKIFFKPPEI